MSSQPISKERPTIKDVAARCGLSVKTISRVINGARGVAADTEARVRKAIAELGYEPNLVARSLRVGRSDAIGVIVGAIDDPFFSTMTAAIESEVRMRSHLLLVASSGEDGELERTLVKALVSRHVSGIIAVPCSTDHSYLAEIGRKVALVFADRPAMNLAADAVLVDNAQGAEMGTQHLISHGHTRIAFVGGPRGVYTLSQRRLGFEAAMHQAGLRVPPELICEHPVTVEDAERTVADLLRLTEPPTAIFAGNSRASLGVVKALHALGRTDVAMVGFDDFETAAALVPAVTVVRQDPAAIGRLATELLFQRISGDSSPPRTVLVPTTLVARGSAEFSPAQPV